MQAQNMQNRQLQDISADNKAILKKRFPGVYESLGQQLELQKRCAAEAVTAKNGASTLKIIKNSREFFMHSRYDPVREAEAVLDKYGDIEKYNYIVFYGAGLGHHIDVFAKRHPDKKFFIHEPVAEILYRYLACRQLNKLPSSSLQGFSFESGGQETGELLNLVLKKAKQDILVIELPAHTEIFPEEWSEFSDFFKKRVKGRKSSLRTNYAYQKRWVLNSIINFGQVLNTPNILLADKDLFYNKPAVLVAAGPSLSQEIENLRYIKENGLAYIFSVGSAINTLIYHGIYPHAACTYDPQKVNQQVFKKIKELDIADVPTIFGSSVGYETILNYPGNKLHMLTSQDTVGNYFLSTGCGCGSPKVADAPTIAIVTLELLYKLGFGRVILVGQNLSFKGGKRHAEGVDYSRELSDREIQTGIWVKDVNEEDVLTSEGYNRMRTHMEAYIRKFEGVEFINTTSGGAKIEGAPYLPFDEVVEKYLDRPVVDENWHEMPDHCYDAEYMKERLAAMNRARDEAGALLDKIEACLKTIEKLCRNRNFAQAEKTYTLLVRVFNRLKANHFFSTFIFPMNRVFYQMLSDETDEIKKEKNKLKKGEKVINAFGRFLFECRKDFRLVTKAYPRIEKAVKDYAACC